MTQPEPKVFSKTYPINGLGVINRYAEIERLLDEWRVELHLIATRQHPARELTVKLEVSEAE